MRYMVKHNPMQGIDLVDNFDRMFGSFFNGSPVRNSGKPAVDVRETDAEYLLEMDLPGVPEKDVNIKVEENLLTISASSEENKSEEKEEKEEKGEKKNYLIRERKNFSFVRSFVLPADADVGNITALFDNGVLSLKVGKTEKAKPKSIKINTK